MTKTESIVELDENMHLRLRLRQGSSEVLLSAEETAVLRNRLLDVSLWEGDRQQEQAQALMMSGSNSTFVERRRI